MASDAFFPFPDGPQTAIDAGVTAIIQPGGSKRDPEVVEACDAAGVAMVFTVAAPLPALGPELSVPLYANRVRYLLAGLLVLVSASAAVIAYGSLHNIWADYQDSSTSSYLLFGLPPLAVGSGGSRGGRTHLARTLTLSVASCRGRPGEHAPGEIRTRAARLKRPPL